MIITENLRNTLKKYSKRNYKGEILGICIFINFVLL